MPQHLMTFLLVCEAFAVCGVGAGAASPLCAAEGDARSKADYERFQGDWRVESVTDSGQDQQPQGAQVTIAGGVMTFRPNAAAKERDCMQVKFRLNAATNPKSIDTEHQIDSGKPIVQRGIYVLRGDKLTLLLESAGKPRPDGFDAKAAHTFVLKRIKEPSK